MDNGEKKSVPEKPSVFVDRRLRTRFRRLVRQLYIRLLRGRISDYVTKQRVKLIWHGWGYLPMLTVTTLPLTSRLRLIARCLRVDWNVPHGHRPREMAAILRALGDRKARPGEVLLEAGCWKGGSSAKFSVMCKMLGYRLAVYDSFEGVETMTAEEKAFGGTDFSGAYAATEDLVRDHIRRFGEIDVCSLHKGWFESTLASVPVPVRVAYIDCDLAKGTMEVLQGVMAALVDDGAVFSQDCHILPVQVLITSPETWTRLGVDPPAITMIGEQLAQLTWTRTASARPALP